MIRNTPNSQNFEFDELLVLLDCVRWQRQYAQDDATNEELEEFVLYHRFLEHKISGYLENYQKSGDFV